MRLALHTVVCCCLFTVVLPLIRDERNSSLKKRFKLWLENHTKRDVTSSSAGAGDGSPDIHVGAEPDRKAATTSPAPSLGLNVRPKRSVSTKTSGCNLGTCIYHDLLHELYKFNNNPKDAKAPPIKIGSTGYGRRRRSLVPRLTGRPRRSSEAGQRVCTHKSTCAMA